ncbi:hypothetical protein CFB3_37590 [Clostridium folliculivorans]|nr:hypothetical protein CFB3_37590 [Clostridium folliculivorans]
MCKRLFNKNTPENPITFVYKYLFIDIWIKSNPLLSVLALYISTHISNYYIRCTKSIHINQKSIKYKKQNSPNMYAIKSSRRIISLLVHNFAEIVLWFSTSYIVLAENFNIDLTNKFIHEVIHIIFTKIPNSGTTDFIHKTFYGIDIIWLQAFIGLFMTLLILARFIGTLPLPTILENKTR